MNDKIVLHLPHQDFKLTAKGRENFEQNANFTTQKRNGEIVREVEETFYRDEETKTIFSINSFGLRVMYNPNKIANKVIGEEPLTYDEFHLVNEFVKEQSSEIGIDASLNNAKIVRRDTSFDLRTACSYSEYSPLIKTLAPSSKIRQSKQRIIENSFYSGNKSREITIYDKTAEQDLKEDFCRIEARIKKPNRKYKLILKDITESRFYSIKQQQKKFIQDNIFSRKPIILDSRILCYLNDLIRTTESKPQIYTAMFKRVISEELNRLGIDYSSVFSVERSNSKAYQLNRRIRIDVNSYYAVDSLKLVELYEELKSLFEKAS